MTLRKTGECKRCKKPLYGDDYGAAGHRCMSMKDDDTDKKKAFIFGYQAGVLAMGCNTVRDPNEVYEQWVNIKGES